MVTSLVTHHPAVLLEEMLPSGQGLGGSQLEAMGKANPGTETQAALRANEGNF